MRRRLTLYAPLVVAGLLMLVAAITDDKAFGVAALGVLGGTVIEIGVTRHVVWDASIRHVIVVSVLVTVGLAVVAARADAALMPGVPGLAKGMVVVEQCDLRPLPGGGYSGSCRIRYCHLGRDGWPRACWRTVPWTVGGRSR